uniref:Xylulose kinase-1 n=1 Tax=Tanacetum cinerariifolium TaxID=118510 RepID=A0A6L2N251_TANCI|nr:hypothetical protein [Tanacetum cinerariifolium]
MALTFTDTHNMIAFLTKLDASKGFEQIIDFLNSSVIQYALMVNPTIYVSCIKQFWSFVSLKKTNDVVRLQALIDRRKVIITEDIVRQALQLDDVDSIDCLPNEEIFVELARMGNVDSPSKFYMYTRFLKLMINDQVVHDDVADNVADDVADVVADADAEPTPHSPTPATTPPYQQELIPSLLQIESIHLNHHINLPLLNHHYLHHNNHLPMMLQYLWISLIHYWRHDDEAEPAELKEVIEVLTTAKLMIEVVTAAATTITYAPMPKAFEEPKPLKRQAHIEQDEAYARELEAELNANINWNEVIEHVKRKEKQDNTVMIYQALKRKPQTKAHARKNLMVYLRNMDGFKMDYFKGMTYDEIRPIFGKHFNYIMAFLEKGEKELEEEASKQSKRKSETSDEKAAKKQKLDEEVEELKTHLQIIPHDEDDVYTEATPLALKVHVVDYQIYTEHNKPYYKIIRADETHQLFLSFISLLRNFDREDLEMLWKIVQERFASSEPKNFSDDFLLNTLKAMFEKPNVEDSIWKNQRGRYGLAKVKSWKLLESCGVYIITFTTTQMILLVERRYPLTRFTLDQMLNDVRLEVEKESEVSLELLRFVRRHQQEGYKPE